MSDAQQTNLKISIDDIWGLIEIAAPRNRAEASFLLGVRSELERFARAVEAAKAAQAMALGDGAR